MRWRVRWHASDAPRPPAAPSSRHVARILITDEIAREGIELLAAHHEVDARSGLSEQELIAAVAGVSALIVRSQTQVSAALIAAAPQLEVIGRAGVGVDNIDVDAATRAGVTVVNAPLANTISAAEHAFGLMLALARNIPQADAALRAGRWERSRFAGVELAGRTLGIVGLGRVGSEVARRARAFDMRVVAVDPFVSRDRASALGVELVELDQLLAESDFVTLHTTLYEGTRQMLDAERLARVKPGARIVNTARGELIDEQALLDAVRSGHIAGAAVDVFNEEPATGSVLITSEHIVVTPHLGASTAEAQDRAAVDVAEQVLAVLDGRPAHFAVNAPLVDPETMAVIGPFIDAAELAARVAMQLATGPVERVRVQYLGEIANYELSPLRAAVIVGMFERVIDEKLTIVNAASFAERHGIHIHEQTGPAREPYANLVVVSIVGSDGESPVAATHTPQGVRVVAIGEYEGVEISPQAASYVVAIENEDRPGMIGKVGKLLGDRSVNINYMSVAAGSSHRALMVLGIDRPLSPAELDEVAGLEDIVSARQIDLS